MGMLSLIFSKTLATPEELNLPRLKVELTVDEGKKSKAYLDTKGKVTVGIGRNLTDVGLSDEEIDLLWENDVKKVCLALDKTYPWWRNKSQNVQHVLFNLCFNMGIETLNNFIITMDLIEKNKFADAGDALLQSKYATQVGRRAERLAQILRNEGNK